MRSVIIIPARYASTRLPAKPLVSIKGQTLLQRVVALSQAAIDGVPQTAVYVATDDVRIETHCQEIGIPCLMTPSDLPTGTDRVAYAAAKLREKPDFILNMQGDAALTPPDFLRALIQAYQASPCDVITPVTKLSWQELDIVRQNKLTTPFSGTTATFDLKTGKAFWFSKNIIPAIRNEAALRAEGGKSPVHRHIGLYGFSYPTLMQYAKLPEGYYERLDGIEVLRLIEQGYHVRCVPVDYKGRANMSGIDSPEDVKRAEALIEKHGELLEAL
jgi:3-deoxy-manno-octulosonate cytidylyltransferase (CMP-KDO synthetase)